jgi:hypothetical protein
MTMSQTENGDRLLERDLVVNALRVQIYSGQDGLAGVPKTLERVIAEDIWRDRIDTRTRERFTFDLFAEFVVADPPAGLGASIDLVKRLVSKTPAELPLALALRPGRGRRELMHTGIEVPSLHGSTRAYLLNRLGRDHPELFARVEAGELAVAAAAREAGITRRQRSIRIDSPGAAIKALLRVFTAGELRRALDELEQAGDE